MIWFIIGYFVYYSVSFFIISKMIEIHLNFLLQKEYFLKKEDFFFAFIFSLVGFIVACPIIYFQSDYPKSKTLSKIFIDYNPYILIYRKFFQKK